MFIVTEYAALNEIAIIESLDLPWPTNITFKPGSTKPQLYRETLKRSDKVFKSKPHLKNSNQRYIPKRPTQRYHNEDSDYYAYRRDDNETNEKEAPTYNYWNESVTNKIRLSKQIHMSRDMTFPTTWYVRPAKPQISLRIRAVWSEPLLVVWLFFYCSATDWTPFQVSKLKGRLHMLVWVCTCQIAT